MFNFSTVLLVCGTIIYVMQNDFPTSAVLVSLGIVGRIVSFAIEIGGKNGDQNEKKEREILQEHVH